MISLMSSVAVGLLLGILLWRVWMNTATAEFSGGESEADDEYGVCPKEIVLMVFGREDEEFVAGLNSARLKAAFVRERKLIGQQWVRETAAAIRRVMLEHTRAARSSSDLQFGLEINIYLRYVALQIICGFLFLLIKLARPVHVRELSLYVYRMSANLTHTHEALQAAIATRQFPDMRKS
jgi:hypothetical protein